MLLRWAGGSFFLTARSGIVPNPSPCNHFQIDLKHPFMSSIYEFHKIPETSTSLLRLSVGVSLADAEPQLGLIKCRTICAHFVPKIRQNKPKLEKPYLRSILACFGLIYCVYWVCEDARRRHLVTPCLSLSLVPPFHGGDTSSNLVGDAIEISNLPKGRFFCWQITFEEVNCT